jgi:uncharacterized protein (DUF2141 family)
MLVLILICAQAVFADEQLSSITVKVSGLKNDNGVVRVALFNNEEKYRDAKGAANKAMAFMKEIAPIKNKEATCTFTKVPYGTYAIKLFHDEDNSGEFHTNMLGMPKVEYGFSNNAKGTLGPAPFDKASFQVNVPEITQSISIQ